MNRNLKGYMALLVLWAVLGFASLAFAGRAGTCVCADQYTQDYRQCGRLFKRNSPEYDACVAEAEAKYFACYSTTPGCGL
jgi:hypothetical protein